MGMITRIVKILGLIKGRAGDLSRQLLVDPGGGASVTVPIFSPTGEDSSPLPTDRPLIIECGKTGTYACVGFVDPLLTSNIGPGEKHFYARSSAGVVKGRILMRSDGTILITNNLGLIEFNPSGMVNINGVNFNPDGSVTFPGDVSIAAKMSAAIVEDSATGNKLGTHTHPSNGAPPTPGT